MKVEKLYDQLFSFESRRTHAPYPIHKRIRFHEEPDLDSWLVKNIPFREGDWVLDAGCGTGHTLVKLSENFRISGLGVSLSKREIQFAKAKVQHPNLSFQVGNYDDLYGQRFDKIVCVESLKHSQNLKHSIETLKNSLHENGHLIIADDFLTVQTLTSDFHKQLWMSPALVTYSYLEKILINNGFELKIHDLTQGVPMRKRWKLNSQIIIVRLLNWFLLNKVQLIKTYLGALVLEKMYARKEAQYLVIVAKFNS